jgi:16S rRNA (cytidine1402-2'-O)-methyltransferase
MTEIFGGEREAVVARELTKTYEETIRGTLGELAQRFTASPTLGEVTIVVAGADTPREAFDEASALEILRVAGLSLKDASAVIAKLTGTSRREVYQRGLSLK